MQESLYEEMYRMEQVHWWFTGRRQIVNHLARRALQHRSRQDLRVCEVGCGTGGNLETWLDAGEAVGIEPSPEARQWATQRLGDRVRAGSLPDQLPAEPSHWDLVLMTDVLEHVQEDRASAKTALRLLRPGGVLVATVPAHPWLYSPRDRHHHHFRRYRKTEFRELFNVPGFRVEILSFYNCGLFPIAASLRLLSKWRANEESASEQRGAAGGEDLAVPPRWLNRLLHHVFAIEQWLLPTLRLPWGLSLVAVVRRENTEWVQNPLPETVAADLPAQPVSSAQRVA